jgi:ATP-dependent DNA ligase
MIEALENEVVEITRFFVVIGFIAACGAGVGILMRTFTDVSRQTPARIVAFDLLALGDTDYSGRPFFERRTVLEDALSSARAPVHLTPATTDRAEAERWFHQFEGAGVDGVVAKPLDSVYQPDKRVMFKVKHERTADCVVAGYRLHKSASDRIGSLLLGLYNDAGEPNAESVSPNGPSNLISSGLSPTPNQP